MRQIISGYLIKDITRVDYASSGYKALINLISHGKHGHYYEFAKGA